MITTPSDAGALWPAQAGRLMCAHPRQTWLVPLLAAPLSQVALSPCCTRDVLAWCAPNLDLAETRREAAAIAAIARAVDTRGTMPAIEAVQLPGDLLVDFRFAGHSQSGLIQDRAARSGARFLGVRSGKGSLARVVAGALLNQR